MYESPVNITPFERVVKRGEVYYIRRKPISSDSREIDPKNGRPAVIISHDNENFMSGTVEVAYLTSKVPRFPRDTQFEIRSGKLKRSVCKTEQITTVDKRNIGDFVCELTSEEMNKLDACLLNSIGISDERISQLTKVSDEQDTKLKRIAGERNSLSEQLDKAKRELASAYEDLRKAEFDREELKGQLQKATDSHKIEELTKERDNYKNLYESLVKTITSNGR